MMKSALILTLVSLCGYNAAKYPSDLGRCHYGDRACLKKTINEYAVKLKDGRRELGLVPIDPLQVDEVKIEQGNNSPVTVNLKFTNLKCFGLSQAKIKNVIGFEKDIATSKYEIMAHIDRISLVGNYKARGRILVLPVYGNGPANLTFDNVDATIKILPKVEMKNGKQHLRISELLLNFETTRLWMNFANLFNGEQALSDSTNMFLNDNWSDILKELKPVMTKAIGEIYKQMADPIFSRFPYEDLFLHDDE